MSTIWDHSAPFPPDPNAPAPRRVDALERKLAQLRLIGPAAGADLRRLVYGGDA